MTCSQSCVSLSCLVVFQDPETMVKRMMEVSANVSLKAFQFKIRSERTLERENVVVLFELA